MQVNCWSSLKRYLLEKNTETQKREEIVPVYRHPLGHTLYPDTIQLKQPTINKEQPNANHFK